MSENFTIHRAIASDAHEVAATVGELLAEIMKAIGVQAFKFDLSETTSRLAFPGVRFSIPQTSAEG